MDEVLHTWTQLLSILLLKNRTKSNFQRWQNYCFSADIVRNWMQATTEAQIQLILPRIPYLSLYSTEERLDLMDGKGRQSHFWIVPNLCWGVPSSLYLFPFLGGISKLWLSKILQQIADYSKNQQSDNIHIYGWTQKKRIVHSCSFVQCKSRTRGPLCFNLYTTLIQLLLSLSPINHSVLQSAWLSPTSAANSTQLRYIHMQHDSFGRFLFFAWCMHLLCKYASQEHPIKFC
jgi:hypothetical protein